METGDQGHVAEHARVSGEVDRAASLEADDDPARLAQVLALVRAGGVKCVHEREVDAAELPRSALVQAGERVVDLRALVHEPGLELDLGHDVHAGERLGERDRVADVIAVTVGDRDHVDVRGLPELVGCRRVAREPRVDVDLLALVALEQKRRVPEPGE